MLKYIFLVIVALLTGCATVDRVPTDYAGADAGKVVIGMGAAIGTSYSSYSLLFRRIGITAGADKQPVGRFNYFQENMFYSQPADYKAGSEAGVVLVQSLPPGDYEIFNFNVFFNDGTVQNNYYSKSDVSIPFTVKTGEVAYLGNYQANRLTGKNFIGMSLPAGAVFVVSDRLAEEIRLAETKSKQLLAGRRNFTPNAKELANPFFLSSGAAVRAQ